MLLDPTSAPALALLDELDTPAPAKPQPVPWWDELCVVADMPAYPYEAAVLARIPEATPWELLRLVNTTHRPGALWAAHVALDAHGIPPCVRPTPEGIENHHRAAFITILADLLWIATRHPGHKPQLQRMRGVLRQPDTPQWHRAALWAFQHCKGQPGLLARRLALTDAQRAQTATMPTRNEANRRRALPDQLEAIREKLLDHALDHPDKSGRMTPDALADKRTKLLRLFLLLGRDRKALHAYSCQVDGVTTTLRALELQLDAIARIAGAQRLVHGPTRGRLKES